MLSQLLDKNSADKKFRQTQFSADKIFRRTNFSAQNQIFEEEKKSKKKNLKKIEEEKNLSATFQIFYLQRLSAIKWRSFFTGCQKSVTNPQTHKRTNGQSEI